MNNAASIKARLRNLAAKEHKPYDYVQTHYMIERLLYRLSISKYADDFVLKGGLLLHVLFAEKARATASKTLRDVREIMGFKPF